jgi:hypothetical protein
MAVRLAAIQASVATTWTYVQSSPASPSTATAIYSAALYSLHALLQADDEQLHGWWRAALLLSDLSRGLLLDTLAPSSLAQGELRLASLRDLPEINMLSSLDDIHSIINGAIGIGAPRYNAGDIIGCCTVYWATMIALVSAPVFRGFPGYAKAMAPLREIVEQTPPPLPIIGQGIDEFAWQLRHALDVALAIHG